MHVAMISNLAWLDEELVGFRALTAGLLGEGIEMLQVLPDSVAMDEAVPASSVLMWRDSPWAALRGWRLRRLAGDLDEARVDLIHAVDGRLWSGAVRLAQKLEAPVVLSASSEMDLRTAERLRRRLTRLRAGVIAKTEPLARALRDRLPPEVVVEVIRPGIVGERDDSKAQAMPGSLCAVITGEGEYDEDCEALLAAVRRFIADHPQSQFFFDSRKQEKHAFWEAARAAGLLPNFSTVARKLGHRELLLQADVMIHPQPHGRYRSLTLQAMAGAMPVLARNDPWLDYLIEDQTAWVVQKPDADRWWELLERTLSNRDAAIALGDRAQQFVTQRYDRAMQIRDTAQFYRDLAGAAIRFPGGGSASPPHAS